MRVLLAFIPVLVACLAQDQEVQTGEFLGLGLGEHLKAWEDFKKSYTKSYDSMGEEMKRLMIFIGHRINVDKHNREEAADGRHGFETGINEYADLSSEEFVKVLNGFKPREGSSPRTNPIFLEPENVELPQKVDWRPKGYVTPVKNQGQCGSCWAFSTTGSLEGQHFKKTGKLVSLSEQNLVDCSGKYGNMGCEGGLMDQAFQYIKDNGGIDTEQSYPYEARDDTCKFKKTSVGATDTAFVDIPSGNENALKKAVATVGPISVAIDASQWSFQLYKKGVYNEPECSSSQLDHGVLAVGYGRMGRGKNYWIVKNSWGESWGQKGYIFMSRNKNNQCGIATQASYPLV